MLKLNLMELPKAQVLMYNIQIMEK